MRYVVRVTESIHLILDIVFMSKRLDWLNFLLEKYILLYSCNKCVDFEFIFRFQSTKSPDKQNINDIYREQWKKQLEVNELYVS
jgi:hypothetical protein